jgi:hypothetical protein
MKIPNKRADRWNSAGKMVIFRRREDYLRLVSKGAGRRPDAGSGSIDGTL